MQYYNNLEQSGKLIKMKIQTLLKNRFLMMPLSGKLYLPSRHIFTDTEKSLPGISMNHPLSCCKIFIPFHIAAGKNHRIEKKYK